MNRMYLKPFDQILHDNTSGSSTLLDNLMHVFETNFGKKNLPEKDLTDVIHHLQNHFRSFAVIQHFLRHLEKNLESPENIQHIVAEYREKWSNNIQKLIHKAISEISNKYNRILIHSHSSTVIQLLLQVDRSCRIIQLESRPALEGRKQASRLLKAGFNVTVVVDAMASLMLQETDLVILGADAITISDFVNKTGSYQVCLLAQYFEVPVMLIADPRKIITHKELSYSDYNTCYSPDEVWSEPPEKMQVINKYFEKIPLTLVDYKILE